jgi:glutamate-1-semialdehyde 2,1-aminomutase
MTSERVAELMAAEQALYARTRPRSRALYEQGKTHWLYGAPSHWMRRWIGGWPIYVAEAPRPPSTEGSVRFRDVDGNEYVDFCLGDTGGMCGHGHPAVVEAMARQARVGSSLMLPTDDAAWVGAELQRRFGLPYWNLATSASDANRACIRLARMVTGRPRVLVFSGAYHGSIEEAHIELDDAGQVRMRNGIHPNAFPHDRLSRVVEFNDLPALEAALRAGDVACVLAEPAMTNYGIIAPQPGFHAELRRLTREAGTLLVIDETHTNSSGPGGYTRAHGLEPDLFVLGKAIAGGIPAAVFGLSQATAERVWRELPPLPPTARQSAHAGFGGTLAGNALTIAVMRAVL